MMLSRTIVLAVAVAMALAAGALAATAAKDPLKLALKASDMPANVYRNGGTPPHPNREDADDVAILGVKGTRAAEYGYLWPADPSDKGSFGTSNKVWTLEGAVYVAPNRAGARKLFAYGKQSGGFFLESDPQNPTLKGLPSYGDEQFAQELARKPAWGPLALVLVRKGAVVWQMRIRTDGRKWNPTKAQMLTQLKKYALKQKVRVGSG
jgi:hypothetical protein